MKNIFNAFLLFCLIPAFSFAQTGSIAGTVVEAESGFTAIGANVVLSGTTTGSSTDLDGKYQINNLEPGTYTIECSYIGFETVQITEVVVVADEVTPLDISLGSTSFDIDEVVVVAKTFKNTEAAVLTIQKKSAVVLDGISSLQISKSGDSDVASAVKRVTGVTIEGGKYVYIRGLGDRYSKTTLNRGEVPGLDPNRNTVQMDLFPTNLVDNIIVYKTFAPNLPGDFTGGYVDITTKDFPEEFTMSASVGLGFHSYGSLNGDLLKINNGSTDFLGIDNGDRDAPQAAFNAVDNETFPTFSGGLSDESVAQELVSLSNQFPNSWDISRESQFLDHSFAFSIGNQIDLAKSDEKELPFGFIGSVTYSRKFRGAENRQKGIYELASNVNTATALTPQLTLTGENSSDEVLWGLLLSGSLKIDQNHKIGLSIMHNQNGENSIYNWVGIKQRDDAEENFQTRTYRYTQRGLTSLQLRGKHAFVNEKNNNIELEWLSSFSLSKQVVPDLRFFTNRQNQTTGSLSLKASDQPPSRFYRNMDQFNFDNKVDLTVPFRQWNELSAQFKTGVAFVRKDREFTEDRFNFNNQAFSIAFPDNIAVDSSLAVPGVYFQESNFLMAADGGGYLNNGTGVYVVENTDPKNSYEADQNVLAGYAMVELPLTKQFKLIAGARLEQSTINFFSFDEGLRMTDPRLAGEESLLDELVVLPSINLNYEFTEKSKLRAAYTRTVARPTFRELAPYANFETDGGFIIVGNPDLVSTDIDNVDLRFEIYPNPGEIFSISAFYKKFANPIEKTFNTVAANTELTWRNVDNAFLVGGEIEARKKLGFIGEGWQNISIGANFSYIYSQTDIDSVELDLIRALDPDASDTRPVFGQADYVVNALLSYANEKGTKANLAYNVVGPRISVVTRGATPEYKLQPFNSLNFNISQRVKERWNFKLSANNILNATYRETAEFNDQEFIIEQFDPGFSISFGVTYSVR